MFQIGLEDPDLVCFYPTQLEILDEAEEDNYAQMAELGLLGEVPEATPAIDATYVRDKQILKF